MSCMHASESENTSRPKAFHVTLAAVLHNPKAGTNAPPAPNEVLKHNPLPTFCSLLLEKINAGDIA